MSNPNEIMRRIQRRQQAQPEPARAFTPAPAPIRAAPAPQRPPTAPQPDARPAENARPAGHTLYSQLMRSHDRVRTKHLRNES